MRQQKTIQLRKNNQITLPAEVVSPGTTLFTYEKQKGGAILLKPLKTIPADEAWIYENPEVLASIRRGLEQSAKGQATYLGSFRKYLKEK